LLSLLFVILLGWVECQREFDNCSYIIPDLCVQGGYDRLKPDPQELPLNVFINITILVNHLINI